MFSFRWNRFKFGGSIDAEECKKIKTFNVDLMKMNMMNQVLQIGRRKDWSQHYEIKINVDDMLNEVENIANMVDEPFSDSSIIPTFIVSKLASSKVKVVLSGDGGDEIFLGYNRYSFAKRVLKFKNRSPTYLENLLVKE